MHKVNKRTSIQIAPKLTNIHKAPIWFSRGLLWWNKMVDDLKACLTEISACEFIHDFLNV